MGQPTDQVKQIFAELGFEAPAKWRRARQNYTPSGDAGVEALTPLLKFCGMDHYEELGALIGMGQEVFGAVVDEFKRTHPPDAVPFFLTLREVRFALRCAREASFIAWDWTPDVVLGREKFQTYIPPRLAGRVRGVALALDLRLSALLEKSLEESVARFEDEHGPEAFGKLLKVRETVEHPGRQARGLHGQNQKGHTTR
ncbi:MAG: hypothetical protein WEB59_01970 [Thermoanaerobaculia bacterium]